MAPPRTGAASPRQRTAPSLGLSGRGLSPRYHRSSPPHAGARHSSLAAVPGGRPGALLTGALGAQAFFPDRDGGAAGGRPSRAGAPAEALSPRPRLSGGRSSPLLLPLNGMIAPSSQRRGGPQAMGSVLIASSATRLRRRRAARRSSSAASSPGSETTSGTPASPLSRRARVMGTWASTPRPTSAAQRSAPPSPKR